MKDIYIQFRGKYKIDGESRDNEHKGWLEVNTWDHLIRQPKSATASSAAGHTSERCEHADLTFMKDMDSTSARILQGCSAGNTDDDIQIDFYRANRRKRCKDLEAMLLRAFSASVVRTGRSVGEPEENDDIPY